MACALEPVCAQQAVCKCCGADAFVYGVVDFSKSCEERRGTVLAFSGVPIYYHRCPYCGFLFTTAFDHFSAADFLEHIYNDSYALVDPDYERVRPVENLKMLLNLFPEARPERLLDYGSGNGRLAGYLREAGFPSVEGYDPFVPAYAVRPTGKFDCIICFEVVEHATDPVGLFEEMNDLLTENGMILFSTVLQPKDIDDFGLFWWYAGPRNGHVSLHTKISLHRAVSRFGFQLGSFDECCHVLFREVPDFAKRFIRV
jgi:SAM-dependent methyltransferase